MSVTRAIGFGYICIAGLALLTSGITAEHIDVTATVGSVEEDRPDHETRSLEYLSLQKISRAVKKFETDVTTFQETIEAAKDKYVKGIDAEVEAQKAFLNHKLAIREEKISKVRDYCETVDKATCAEAVHVLYEEKWNLLADKFAHDRMEITRLYTTNLARYEVNGMKLEERLNMYMGAIHTKVAPEDRTKVLEYLESVAVVLAKIQAEIKVEIEMATEILFTDLRMEFVGATGEVPVDEYHVVNKKIEIALKLAFIEEGVDFLSIFSLGIVAQDFVAASAHGNETHIRRLGEKSRVGRILNRNGALRMQAFLAYQCTCVDDGLTSDVSHRSVLETSPLLETSPDSVGTRMLLIRLPVFRYRTESWRVSV